MGHRIDLFCALRQKLTIIESGLQGLKAKVEANDVHAERDVRNHLDRVRIPGDTGMERSRNGFRPAVTLFTYCSRQCLDSATAQAAGRPDPAERAGAQSRPANESHRADLRESYAEF
jgi:hypothetical protein